MMAKRVITSIIIILVLASAAIYTWKHLSLEPSRAKPEGIAWYVNKAQQWELQARVLRSAQVVLAAAALIASVLSAAKWKPPKLPDGLLAVIAAVSISLLTGLDLTTQANKLRRAERHLTYSILEFQLTSSKSFDNLLKAYRESEDIIGDYSPQVGPLGAGD